ncbi:MAG: hypothetical protein ACE14V_12610 [bacterium]
MRKLLIIGILCCFVSISIGKQGIVIQPWQKEYIQIPSISTTYKITANPSQMRLLTKYNAIEQAYAELGSFILTLPVDSTRSLQMILDKKEQLGLALDKLIRNKAVFSGFEYTSDSSAKVNIGLDAQQIVKLFSPYWKPEPVPKPKKVKVKKAKPETEKEENESAEKADVKKESKETKEAKPVAKPDEKKPEPTKSITTTTIAPVKSEEKKAEPAKPTISPIKPVENKGDAAKPEPMKPVIMPTRSIPPTPPAPVAVPVPPSQSNPNPNANKDSQSPKQDSTTP